MYRLMINENLESKVYENFIDYAFSRSDAFMFVIYKYSENLDAMFKMPNKKIFKNEETYRLVLNSVEESKKKKKHETLDFKKSTKPFVEKLSGFLIKKRDFPTVWPGSAVQLSEYVSVDICTYRVCEEIKDYVLEPKELFNWKYPLFPDDLCFFKDGYCWFTSVSHEEHACLYLEDNAEIERLKDIGIKFNIREINDEDVSLFYEDYAL